MVSNAAPAASSLASTIGTAATSSIHSTPATAIGSGTNANTGISSVAVSLNIGNAGSSDANKASKKEKKKLKGGLTLVYDADGEGADEISMEELRAALPRYQKILSRAASVRT